jgi:hypothetical protein
MATKGTAAKSASGASMSKYDVEVEERLQKLEAALGGGGEVDGDRLAALEAKVEDLIQRLQRKLSF